MPRRVVRVLHADDDTLERGITSLQVELEVTPEFPAEVEAAAEAAAQNPRLPEKDRTDVPFVTIDPASSMDLDQALHIERDGDGYLVHYAIADVAAFVAPGDPVDVEANRRGETLYGPDSTIPLHPRCLCEDAASLLPDQVRPALVWTIRLDETGEATDTYVERALVRSRAKCDYETVQRQLDAGSADEVFTLLGEVGRLRLTREAARGGVSLPLPDQEIEIDGDHWSLTFREMSPVESWNAQISLLTGMVAASMMVYAEVGLLRTLPPADHRDVQRLHRTAAGLGIDWPAEELFPDFIRSLDPANPRHAAMVVSSTRLLRGAGYVGFNGEVPSQPLHSALASEYAHVTAPLRRLVDRYTGEVCVALCAGTDVPSWVLEKLDVLPTTMRVSGHLAHRYENGVVDLVEAALLRRHVGETFPAVVVSVDEDDPQHGDLVIEQPAIEAPASSTTALPLGTHVRARLVEADVARRTVRFEVG